MSQSLLSQQAPQTPPTTESPVNHRLITRFIYSLREELRAQSRASGTSDSELESDHMPHRLERIKGGLDADVTDASTPEKPGRCELHAGDYNNLKKALIPPAAVA